MWTVGVMCGLVRPMRRLEASRVSFITCAAVLITRRLFRWYLVNSLKYYHPSRLLLLHDW